MGSNNQEKWLTKLKDTVQNHTEQLPDNLWEEINRDIPAVVPVKRRNIARKLIWAVTAAAVVVVAFLLYPLDGGDENEVAEMLAVVEPVVPVGVQVPLEIAIEDAVAEKVAVVKGGAVNPVAIVAKEQVAEPVQVKQKQAEQTQAELVQVEHAQAEQAQAEQAQAELAKDEQVEVASAQVKSVVGEEAVAQTATKEKEVEKAPGKRKKRAERLKGEFYMDERRNGRKWLAFSGGNSAIQLSGIGKEMTSVNNEYDVMWGNDNSGGGASDVGTPSVTPGGEYPSAGNFNTFLVMDSKVNNRVEWIGGNSPASFNAVSYHYKHKAPVKLGIMFAGELARNFYAESGLSYQYLESELYGNGNQKQKLHYLGIPLRFTFRFVDTRVFSAYVSGGYLLERCVYGEVKGLENTNEMYRRRINLKEWQNAINASVGAQLNISSVAAVYIEPGVYHYLGMGNGVLSVQNGYKVKNIYSEEPTGFRFEGGLRFSF